MKTVFDAGAMAAVAPFDRDFFDPKQRFKAIGSGTLGGKAHGLAIAQAVLDTRFDPAPFKPIQVSIPSLTVLCTDVFDEFIARNRLEAAIGPDDPDDAIARAFLRADLPVRVLGDLRALIEQVHTPLAVRSSSQLEDDLSRPFAGVYTTKMIPNNQPSADDRFRPLVEAIKLVYASTFFRDALAYLAGSGRPDAHDRMAVIIQEVVGTRFGDRFYPHVGGVARSYNYYPSGHAVPADGVASLALGLGKTVVEGDVCWTYTPAYPSAPAPFGSPAEVAANTQTRFWAVNMGKPPEYDPVRDTEYLLRPGLEDAEQDGTLTKIASTLDRESGRIRMGTGTAGPRVLDFAVLLGGGGIPLNDLLRSLLHLFEDELQTPVEIEFAATLNPERFGLVQVRPMMVSSEAVAVSDEELASPRALLATTRALGNGEFESIEDVVYVRPDLPPPLDTRSIATEIARVNGSLLSRRRPYLLIGFGRWGSSDDSLGIPVVWSQIAGARVIVEAMHPGMNVELSQGSHFFHNLVGFRVPYFSIPLSGRDPIDWKWLQSQPAVTETRLLRHIRLTAPLRVKVDGRTGRGVILKQGR